MKFVHAADLHLDSPMRGLDRYEGAPAARLRGATRRALENLVELCIERGAAFLLVAGDLYDGGWRDYSTGLFFAQQMSRLREANVRVVLVRGNHDAASQITKTLRLPDNVKELGAARPETFELPDLGVAIHGQSFASRAVTEDLASRYPPPIAGAFNVGLLHTCLDGREGHAAYAPTKVETLTAKGYDYWALGHVHAREVIAKDPWIVFPGNLQGRHAREIGAKGATVVGVEDGVVVACEHVALDVARWSVTEVDASGAIAIDDVVDAARAAIVRAVDEAEGRVACVRLVVRGSTRAHAAIEADVDRFAGELRLAANDVGENAVWLEKIAIATRAPIDLEALREKDDAIGELARSLALLREDDVRARELVEEIDAWVAKLPADLREGPDALDLHDPRRLRAIVDDVEQLLLARLVGGAG